MTETYLKNIIDGVCRAAQENNIGSCRGLPEDTYTICCTSENQIVNNFHTLKSSQNHPRLRTFKTDSCFICNGYYGPCFEDVLCSTCHVFLYPNHIPSIFEASSDSDSGTEELDDGQENMSISDIVDNSPALLYEEIQRLSVFLPQLEQVNIKLLPPEVLMHMFQYLDEISLWTIGQVCVRWREILFMCIKPERWLYHTKLRWPLLPIVETPGRNWYELYSSMMKSSSCMKCIKQISLTRMHWEEISWRRNRLRTELRTMQNDPLDGIAAQPLDNICGHWQATIEGPSGSPYEGGLFFLYINVPPTYPLEPPIVRFITKIYHPNISRHGDIGIDCIHHNWSSSLTISKLLISIQSLLTDPYCDVCMEPKIGQMYLKRRKLFDEQARLWTIRFAMHDMFPY